MSKRSAHDWLDRTQEITEKATPGPWEEDGSLIGPRPGASVAQAWGVRWKADLAFIAHSRTALPKAVAALRAVMEVHRMTDDFYEPYKFCVECSSRDQTVAWPCPTITAITETLGEA